MARCDCADDGVPDILCVCCGGTGYAEPCFEDHAVHGKCVQLLGHWGPHMNDKAETWEEQASTGEPEDVEGECNAHLYIADNFGDSHATMRCGLPKGHEGDHTEEFDAMDGSAALVRWSAVDKALP